jgi:hypothetical protein
MPEYPHTKYDAPLTWKPPIYPHERASDGERKSYFDDASSTAEEAKLPARTSNSGEISDYPHKDSSSGHEAVYPHQNTDTVAVSHPHQKASGQFEADFQELQAKMKELKERLKNAEKEHAQATKIASDAIQRSASLASGIQRTTKAAKAQREYRYNFVAGKSGNQRTGSYQPSRDPDEVDQVRALQVV